MIVASGTAPQSAPMCGHPEPPELLLWLTLKCAPGVGPVTAGRLLRHFGDIRALFRARPAEFDRFRGGRRLWDALPTPTGRWTWRACGDSSPIRSAWRRVPPPAAHVVCPIQAASCCTPVTPTRA